MGLGQQQTKEVLGYRERESEGERNGEVGGLSIFSMTMRL